MKSKFRKLLFVLMQPLTYSIRPMFLQPKPVGYIEVRRARVLALKFNFRSLFHLTPDC